jgi:hypothetical protein
MPAPLPPAPILPVDPRVGATSVVAFRAGPRALAEPAAAPALAADGTTGDVVQQAIARAAERFFPGRDVTVASYLDETTGRAVSRIADRQTGQVLFQSPSAELLRFYASMREASATPVVSLEA